jgi:hypothetical protein
MALEFGPDSVRIVLAGGDSAELKLEAVGRGEEVPEAPALVAPAQVEGATVRYARAEGTTEWYVSGNLGLEQGFDLANDPPERRAQCVRATASCRTARVATKEPENVLGASVARSARGVPAPRAAGALLVREGRRARVRVLSEQRAARA